MTGMDVILAALEPGQLKERQILDAYEQAERARQAQSLYDQYNQAKGLWQQQYDQDKNRRNPYQ